MLGGQNPFHEQVPLFLGTVGIDRHESFARRRCSISCNAVFGVVAWQVVYRIQADDGIEAAVGEGQAFGGSKMQAPGDLRFAIHQGVFRNIETERFETRTGADQVFYQKSLGAPYIENARPRPKPEMFDDIGGDGLPAPVIPVASIPVSRGPSKYSSPYSLEIRIISSDLSFARARMFRLP